MRSKNRNRQLLAFLSSFKRLFIGRNKPGEMLTGMGLVGACVGSRNDPLPNRSLAVRDAEMRRWVQGREPFTREGGRKWGREVAGIAAYPGANHDKLDLTIRESSSSLPSRLHLS
jgi:hypothetical protein